MVKSVARMLSIVQVAGSCASIRPVKDVIKNVTLQPSKFPNLGLTSKSLGVAIINAIAGESCGTHEQILHQAHVGDCHCAKYLLCIGAAYS